MTSKFMFVHLLNVAIESINCCYRVNQMSRMGFKVRTTSRYQTVKA